MSNLIDRFLNSITMYKLVLYCLAVTAFFAIIFGFMGSLNYEGWQLLNSAIFFAIFCFLINAIFAKIVKAPATLESSLITGLILFFIMGPIESLNQLFMVFLVSFVAIASKYIIAINRKHIFNPAAFAAVVFGFLQYPATWWVANPYLFPFILVSGLLIVRKIKRFPMVFSYMLGFLMMFFVSSGFSDMLTGFASAFISWPIIFFSSVMLTEPVTLMTGNKRRIVYGFIIGLFLGYPFSIFDSFATTPEIILIMGNIISFVFSLKGKIIMRFEEKIQLNKDSYEFLFQPKNRFAFKPGQFMEWSLPHSYQDSRGIRRYFTIASSPEDVLVKIGVRFNNKISTFKQNLLHFKKGDVIFASFLDGDFVLPRAIGERKEKFVFIAGGIGITPFVSMARDLVNKKERKDVTLFYCKDEKDFAYVDVLKEAERVGVQTIFTDSIDEAMIKKYVPDFKHALWYLSGPNAMVQSYRKLIRSMGVSFFKIKTDYFPGY